MAGFFFSARRAGCGWAWVGRVAAETRRGLPGEPKLAALSAGPDRLRSGLCGEPLPAASVTTRHAARGSGTAGCGDSPRWRSCWLALQTGNLELELLEAALKRSCTKRFHARPRATQDPTKATAHESASSSSRPGASFPRRPMRDRCQSVQANTSNLMPVAEP